MSAARLVPWVVHEVFEYAAGVFLILAPFLFFGDGLGDGLDTAAFPLFVGVGVLLVVLQLLTRGKASIAELLPVQVHATLDYLVALFLVVSPFLFGLTADAEPDAALLVPVLLGVGYLVVTLLTRFPLEDPAAADSSRATEASTPSPGADPETGTNESPRASGRQAPGEPGADDAGGHGDG